MPIVLTNDEVAELVTMKDCLQAVESAFRELGAGEAVSRPRSDLALPQSDPGRYYMLKTFDAALPGAGLSVVRLTSSMLQENAEEKRVQSLPLGPGGTYVGLVLLFSIQTTELVGIIHDARISVLRAGATRGVAAKYLARPDARVVGLFGSGQQAREQLMAMALVRKLERVKVFSPTKKNRERFAHEMSATLSIEVRAVEDPREVVTGSDLILTATTSLSPVFSGAWLEPGQHVSTITGAEVDDVARQKAAFIVRPSADKALQWMPLAEHNQGRTGAEWRVGQSVDPNRLVLLPDLILGLHPGRTAPDQITLFGGVGSYGPAVTYAAVGAIALQRARERGIGTELPRELFLQREYS
jgi:alanine dehydrogenase